ncbi:hypothetical protein [Asanoa sp. NPDC050611]|uniref:hypothetical protein n=1 Tax=Asanoa sp. NPDC050611 TaxID=3157098 RepID=UPI0033EC4304
MDEQQLDEMFDRFRAGPPLAVPAGAGAARQAFRHRRRGRLATGCVLAVVAVGGPSVAFAAGAFDGTPRPPVLTTGPTTPDRSTPPTSPPTTSPTAPPPTTPGGGPTTAKPVEPTGVPSAAMLRASDLPDDYRYAGADVDGDWSLAATTIYCDPPPTGTEPDGTARRGAMFLREREEYVIQVVERMRSAAAAQRFIDGLAGQVDGRECGLLTYTVVDEGFAGDDSVLIRTSYEGRPADLYVFVRQGPLLTQIWQKLPEGVEPMREVARTAADRLCNGTTAC